MAVVQKRAMLIGLDGVPPALAFDQLAIVMPNLAALRRRGVSATLRSTTPPITVPAWACLSTGRDPGELGMYGFTRIRAGSYETHTVTADDLRVPTIGDLARACGRTSAALFVPPSYPTTPMSAARGVVASCLLGDGHATIAPPHVARRLAPAFGAFATDTRAHRSGDVERVATDAQRMTSTHFAIARDVWTTDEPDLLSMVAIGPDRMHHAFLNDMLEPHDALRRHYALLDAELGALLTLVDDDTTVIVASDHGARPFEGGFAINDWLVRHGWLVLRDHPATPTRFSPALVDWGRTRAFALGGHYARIHINRSDEFPDGIVARNDAPRLALEIEDALGDRSVAEIDPNGTRRPARVVRAADSYRACRGVAPELLVFPGDLAYRAISSVGHDGLFVARNDTGFDVANHDWDGFAVVAGRGVEPRDTIESRSLHDVGRTMLEAIDVEPPPGFLGRSFLS